MKKKDSERTVPVQDLGLNKIPTIEEQFDFFHKKGRTINLQEDEGPDDPTFPCNQGSGGCPAFALPNVDLKNNPDYQNGEVKVYTPEEIAEYERQRDWVDEEYFND